MIRKKRGLGAGKINGVGGRLEPGESPLTGVLREAHEELAIALIDPVKRGELHFQFLDGYGLFCSVFVASRFHGRPVETEEAAPVWFDLQRLPLDEMWEMTGSGCPGCLTGNRSPGFLYSMGRAW